MNFVYALVITAVFAILQIDTMDRDIFIVACNIIPMVIWAALNTAHILKKLDKE